MLCVAEGSAESADHVLSQPMTSHIQEVIHIDYYCFEKKWGSIKHAFPENCCVQIRKVE